MFTRPENPISNEMFYQMAVAIHALYHLGIFSPSQLASHLEEPLLHIQKTVPSEYGKLPIETLYTILCMMKVSGAPVSFKNDVIFESGDNSTPELYYGQLMEHFFETLCITLDGNTDVDCKDICYDWDREYQVISDDLLEIIMNMEYTRLMWTNEEEHRSTLKTTSFIDWESQQSTLSESWLNDWDNHVEVGEPKFEKENGIDKSLNQEDFFDFETEDFESDDTGNGLKNLSLSRDEIELLNTLVLNFKDQDTTREVFHQLRFLMFTRISKQSLSINELFNELSLEIHYAAYLADECIVKVRAMLLETLHFEKQVGRIDQASNGDLVLTDLGKSFIDQLSYIVLEVVGMWSDMEYIIESYIHGEDEWMEEFRDYQAICILSSETMKNLVIWYIETL